MYLLWRPDLFAEAPLRGWNRCHSAFVSPGWQNRTREETPGGFSLFLSEAGRITPLALNGQMRASEPEG